MKNLLPILSITGSDPTGGSGIQADIKTISVLGGYAVTAVTAVTVQNSQRIVSVEQLPTPLVLSQISTIFDEVWPRAVKIGLVPNAETVRQLASEVSRCTNIVLDPGFLSSRGEKLIADDVVEAFRRYLFPKAKVLILKCKEAEMLLGVKIASLQNLQQAATDLLKFGVESVLLQGGHYEGEFVTDVFVDSAHADNPHFISSPNISGWSFHGVVGILSSAIATLLGRGETIEVAIDKAHDYIRNLVVYSVASDSKNIIHQLHNQTISARSVDIYNNFITLVANNCIKAKDVKYYADKLNITPRYLSQITHRIVGNMPKKIIDGYIMTEVEQCILSSSLSIQELAYKFGFASQSAFCKFFKSQKGISPTQFRNIN